ncbi:MAG: ComEA family DNA-binding protein [Phycisphaerales bacterium JB037]
MTHRSHAVRFDRVATRGRRGVILYAVLIIVVLGTLSGASILLRADAQVSASSAVRARDQVRSLAWSGLQGVMSELAEQREDMLDGELPRVTESWELFRDGSGAVGIIRLVDLTPEDPESPIQPETGKLNINLATEEMLAAIEPIGPDLAEKIIAARARGPFASVEELLTIEGMTPDLLFGELTDLVDDYGSVPAEPAGAGGFSLGDDAGPEMSFEVSADTFEPTADLRLIDLLTVHTFDPNIQAGLMRPDARGDLRLNLNLPWSEGLGRAISARWNDDAANALRALMTSGTTFRNDAAIVTQLDRLAPEAYAIWDDVLDAITTTDDQFRPGRVDLNVAPFEVLRAIPGFSRESALAVVELRNSLSAADRRSVAWPVSQGILSNAEFREAVDWLSTRSMQWRVRIEVGIAWPDEQSGEVGDLESAPLRERMVVEAIIDVASQRPRIAYLRDVTALDAMRQLEDEGAELFESLGEEVAEAPIEDPFDPAAVRLDEGDGELAEGSLTENGGGEDADRPGRITRLSNRVGSNRMETDGGGGSRVSRVRARGGESEAAETDLPAAVDRRIGRWTTRSGGNG